MIHAALIGIVSLSLAGCGGGTPYAVTTGSHAPVQEPGGRYVVWSNHAGVGQYITGILLQGGYTVVERARLQKIFDEQNLRISLTDSSEKLTAEILKAGKLTGATQVIFAEVHGTERPRTMMEAPSAPSVTVRSVSVQSGAVQWTGTALYPYPMQTPDQAVVALTYWAISRATCHGTWEEPSDSTAGGCRARSQTQEERAESAQYQALLAEKQALDREKQPLDHEMQQLLAEKQPLDQQWAAGLAEKDPQQQQRIFADYRPRLAVYEQRLAEFNKRGAEFSKRSAEFNKRIEEFNKRNKAEAAR